MPRRSKLGQGGGWSDVALDLEWLRHSQEGGILGLQEIDGADFRITRVTPAGSDLDDAPTATTKKKKRAPDGVGADAPARADPDAAPSKRAKRIETQAAAQPSRADGGEKRRKGVASAAERAEEPLECAASPPPEPRPSKPQKLGTLDADKAARHREKLLLRRERMRVKKREASEARRIEQQRGKEDALAAKRAAAPRAAGTAGSGAEGERTPPMPALAARTAAAAAVKPTQAGRARAAGAERAGAPAAAARDGARAPLLAGASAPGAPCNVDAWRPLGLHAELLAALARAGFGTPTPIQAACIPAALERGRDVIGAAETGSGKTLAFGLPIMHHLLAEADAAGGAARAPPRYAPAALCLLPTRELALQVEEHMSALLPREPAFRVVSLVGGMAVPRQRRVLARRPAVVVATPGRLWALISQYSDEYLLRLQHVRFLVLDEADRMVAPGHYAELSAILNAVEAAETRAAAAEGGAREPPAGADADADADADAGAAGDGSDDGTDDDDAPTSAMPHADERAPVRLGRQTFLFSATLTLPAQMRRKGGGAGTMAAGKPGKAKAKARAKEQERRRKALAASGADAHTIDGAAGNPAMLRLLDELKFHNEVEVVDLSTQALTVETLQQRKLACLPEDKEALLWALIRSLAPRRGIVFANSIATVRRLGALLPLLDVRTITLHASMQQRQRLQHLDRFKRTEGGVLLATDVAARGLDIRGLDYVINFHMPYTVEAYVHRAGRTARAHADGVCIALVEPADEKRYRMVCHALGPQSAAGFAPYDALGSLTDVLPRVHRAINLAAKLDAELHDARKKRASSDWLERAAEEMDLELDDELRDEVAQNRATVVSKREQQQARDELRRLLQSISRPTAAQRAAAPHGVRLPFARS